MKAESAIAIAKAFRRKKSIMEFMIVVPALLFYLVFVVYVLFAGIFYSMTDWNGVSSTFQFIGLRNYITLFNDSYVLEPLKNTFVYAFFTTIILNVTGLAMALAVDRVKIGKNLFRVLFFIPAVLSSIVVGYIFNFIFANVLADFGEYLKIGVMANNLLGSKSLALMMSILVASWKMAGWYMVIYIAGLQSIDQSLYEAAVIDGCTGWKSFRFITFPLLAPAFTINMVLALERAFKEYDLVFSLTGGGPGRASELVSLTIYNETFTNKRAGYGAALGVVLFLIIVVVTLFQMKVLRRREDEIR